MLSFCFCVIFTFLLSDFTLFVLWLCRVYYGCSGIFAFWFNGYFICSMQHLHECCFVWTAKSLAVMSDITITVGLWYIPSVMFPLFLGLC